MVRRRPVLVVDEDEHLQEILIDQLQSRGEFVVITATTGEEAIRCSQEQYFDAALVNLGLSDMTGHEVCQTLRAQNFKSPIILMLDVNIDSDVILGLEVGANDHIIKPFRINLLLASLWNHIRHHEKSEFAVLRIGHYSFQPGAKMLVDRQTDKKVRLTDKETAIIKFLYFSGGKVVNRSVLLNEIWGYNASISTHTLETHVYRIRQKIERAPSKSEILVTESDGYRLVI